MLSERQRKFAVAIAQGHRKSESAVIAGVEKEKAGRAAACWLNKEEVCDYIRDLRKMVRCADIADVKEIQAFWTDMMRGQGDGVFAKMSDRLKASEYLGRANNMFDVNMHLQEDLNIKVQVEYITPTPPQLTESPQPEAIEAEYEEVTDEE